MTQALAGTMIFLNTHICKYIHIPNDPGVRFTEEEEGKVGWRWGVGPFQIYLFLHVWR